MGWESSDVVRFDLGPVLQGQTRIARIKSKAVTLLEKRHRVFASKESIRIRVTAFLLSPSGSSREANMADDVNKTL